MPMFNRRPAFQDTNPPAIETPEGRHLAHTLEQLAVQQDHAQQELPEVIRTEVLRQFGGHLVSTVQRTWIESSMAPRQQAPATVLDACARWLSTALTLVAGIGIGMALAAWRYLGA